ncbi:MAG: flagellar brake protein [Trinickia sp.]
MTTSLPNTHSGASDEALVPVGIPLGWPVLDERGMVLMRAGTVIASEEQRKFLFRHFRPQRGALREDGTTRTSADGSNEPPSLSLADMQLSIGAPLGVRRLIAMSGAMRPSRLIGFSASQALFAMPPGAGNQPVTLALGENVQVVAVGTQGVFAFVCTVEAVCHQPFEYLVLSPPGNVRRLRERKSVRVQTHLAVGYSTDPNVGQFDGLGIGRDLSVSGMSLAAPQVVGHPGARVHLSFPVKTEEVDVQLEVKAIVRNVNEKGRSDLWTQGLEFEKLTGEQKFALKSFLLDRLAANSH